MSLYALAQFAALLVAHSDFLALLPKQSTALNAFYFLFLLLSLVLLAGLLENRRIFLVLEAGRLLATAAAVLAVGGWFGHPGDAGVRTAIVLYAVLFLVWLLGAGRSAAVGAEDLPTEAVTARWW